MPPFKEDKATSLQLPNSPTPTFENNFVPLSLAQWESAICYFNSYLRPKLTVCSLTCTASWKEIYDMILEIHFYVFSVKEVYPIPTLSQLPILSKIFMVSRATRQNLTNFQTKTAQKSNPLAPTHPYSSFLGVTPHCVPFNVDNVIAENIATS